jgi:hypothetical protein
MSEHEECAASYVGVARFHSPGIESNPTRESGIIILPSTDHCEDSYSIILNSEVDTDSEIGEELSTRCSTASTVPAGRGEEESERAAAARGRDPARLLRAPQCFFSENACCSRPTGSSTWSGSRGTASCCWRRGGACEWWRRDTGSRGTYSTVQYTGIGVRIDEHRTCWTRPCTR